jgi:hypothetical protein
MPEPLKEKPRWAELVAFIAEWHTPLQPDDGYTPEDIASAEERLGGPFPEALRELYLLIGKREDLTRRQNRLRLLSELEWKDSFIDIWEENQWVCFWSIADEDWEQPDPAVSVLMDGEVVEDAPQGPLSEVALLMVAEETVRAGNYCAGGFTSRANPQPELIAAIMEWAKPAPQKVLAENNFYALDDLLAYPSATELWIAAKDADRLQAAIEQIDQLSWSYISTEDNG